MPYCKKCGNPVSPGALFCKHCGTPAPRDAGGNQASPQNAGYIPPQGVYGAAQYVRCVRCGNIIPMQNAHCGICGTPALEKCAYSRKVSQGRAAREIQQKHGAAALIVMWLQALALVAALIVLFLILANALFKDWLDVADQIPGALCIIIPLMLLLFTLLWGVSRSKAMKKAGFDSAQYKGILDENNVLPKAFFEPLPGEPQIAPEVGKDGKKKMSMGQVAAMTSVLLVICVGASLLIGEYGLGEGLDIGASSKWSGDSDGGNETQDDYLSGKAYSTEDTNSSGFTTVGQAFYFEDGRVYAGAAGDSTAEFKADSKKYSPYDMYYSISGNSITISGSGSSSQWTYNASSDTINAGGTTLFRIN